MKSIEVWINGQKKCVASAEDQVLSAIIDMVKNPKIRIGGLVCEGHDGFHVGWVNEQLQSGDEVRLCLLETAGDKEQIS